MKYLKSYENFEGMDLGRFTDEEKNDNFLKPQDPQDIEDVENKNCTTCEEEEDDDENNDDEEKRREEEDGDKTWGDEVVEKKMNAGFKAFLDKQKNKGKKKSDKCGCDDCGCDKKSTKKEPKKGLSAAQKKLPEHIQKAILAKQNRK